MEAISVNDFSLLLTKENIIALVIFSILIGLAISKVGKDAEPAVKVLVNGRKEQLETIKTRNNDTTKIVYDDKIYVTTGGGTTTKKECKMVDKTVPYECTKTKTERVPYTCTKTKTEKVSYKKLKKVLTFAMHVPHIEILMVSLIQHVQHVIKM